jgi:hypothetical protein
MINNENKTKLTIGFLHFTLVVVGPELENFLSSEGKNCVAMA